MTLHASGASFRTAAERPLPGFHTDKCRRLFKGILIEKLRSHSSSARVAVPECLLMRFVSIRFVSWSRQRLCASPVGMRGSPARIRKKQELSPLHRSLQIFSCQSKHGEGSGQAIELLRLERVSGCSSKYEPLPAATCAEHANRIVSQPCSSLVFRRTSQTLGLANFASSLTGPIIWAEP